MSGYCCTFIYISICIYRWVCMDKVLVVVFVTYIRVSEMYLLLC